VKEEDRENNEYLEHFEFVKDTYNELYLNK